MNRDALLATAIGFFIGITITSIVLFGPSVMQWLPNVTLPRLSLPRFAFNSPAPAAEVAPAKIDNPITKLTIDSPEPESISETNTLTVNGRVPGDAVVIIGGNSDEVVTRSGSSGTFSGKITLSEGLNEITVAAVTDGRIETEMLAVYYTEEKF